MNSHDKVLFTVRSHISKSEPRISCVRTYLSPYDFRIFSAVVLLFLREKAKKQPNKELLKECQNQMFGLEKHEVFSDDSIYYKAIGKFIQSKEGWYNSKLI